MEDNFGNMENQSIEQPAEISSPFSNNFGLLLERLKGPLNDDSEYLLLTREEEYILFTNLIRIRGAIKLFDLNQILPEKKLLIDTQYWEEQELHINGIEEGNPLHELLLYRYNRIMHILMQYNEGLVRSRVNYPDEDKLQSGRMGLLRAIQDFDPRERNKLSTYAIYWIDQAVKRFRYRNYLIYVPEYVQASVKKHNEIESILIQKLKRFPTFREIIEYAKKHNIKLCKINYLKLGLKAESPTSLDEPLNSKTDITLYDLIPLEDNNNGPSQAKTRILEIQEIVKEICKKSRNGERDRAIFWSRFNIEHNTQKVFADVAKDQGIKAERVRQIANELLKEVRSEP